MNTARSNRRVAFLCAGIAAWLGAAVTPAVALDEEGDEPSPPAADSAPSKIRSDEDGWLDLGEFLDEPYGFVPLLVPITEPAVGYGAAGGLVFIDRPPGAARGRAWTGRTSPRSEDWPPTTAPGASWRVTCATGATIAYRRSSGGSTQR